MVVIVQCVIWGNAFKFVYIETMNEYCHKMKKYSSQTIFGFKILFFSFCDGQIRQPSIFFDFKNPLLLINEFSINK
jgi:hypothetical protein